MSQVWLRRAAVALAVALPFLLLLVVEILRGDVRDEDIVTEVGTRSNTESR